MVMKGYVLKNPLGAGRSMDSRIQNSQKCAMRGLEKMRVFACVYAHLVCTTHDFLLIAKSNNGEILNAWGEAASNRANKRHSEIR